MFEGSYQKKAAAAIVAAICIISICVAAYFGGVIKRLQDEQSRTRAREIANTASVCLDKSAIRRLKTEVAAMYDWSSDLVSNDEWHSKEYYRYIRQFSDIGLSEDYQNLYQTLEQLLHATEVEGLYLAYVDPKRQAVVYMVDAGYEIICDPGSFDYLRGEDLKVLTDPYQELLVSVTNTDAYGDIISIAEPMLDANGQVLAYMGVDISMSEITMERQRLLLNTVLTVIVVTLLFCAVALYISGKVLMKPLSENKAILAESEQLKKENRTLSRRVQGEKKITELTESLSALLTNMPAMTYSKDVINGKYLACNQMFAEYVHKGSPKQVVGLTDSQLFNRETAAQFAENDKIALSMERPYTLHEEVAESDGSKRYWQTTKLKFMDASGRLCILGMSTDVSEMVLAKEESAKTMEKYEQAKAESENYSRMARSLASDYKFVYVVNVKTDRFEEYTEGSGDTPLKVEREGDDFFNLSLSNAKIMIYAEDLAHFTGRFSKEKILGSIEKNGKFLLTYRLLIAGVPTQVVLKATYLEEDTGHIIIGVNTVTAPKETA